MSVVGGLPGAPAVAGTVPVASTQAARDGVLALVLGPAGDGGGLADFVKIGGIDVEVHGNSKGRVLRKVMTGV